LTNHEELDHQAGIFSGLWLACKKLWLFFGLAEKRQTYFSSWKNLHLKKFTAKCMAKSINHLSRWKKVHRALHSNC